MSNTDGAAPAAAPAAGELSIAQAVNRLNTPPEQRDEGLGTGDEGKPPPSPQPPDPNPPSEDNAEPDEAPGEDEAEDEAEEPPVQPPRTWTKAEKEAFASLPREHQEAIVARESERDAYYQRGLQEAANKSRAAQAREQAAEQARVQYEAALPAVLQNYAAQFRTEFQDIKTWDDVSNMRQNDPMRFMAWQEAREKGQTLQKEAYQAQERQQQEQSQRYQGYQTAEAVKVEEYIVKDHPEWKKDPELNTSKKVGEKVRAVMLEHYGMTDDEMSAWWHNAAPMYLADSRVQRMALDAFAYRDANAKKAEAVNSRKPVPPVQRPGTASNRGEAANVSIKILNDKLSRTGRIEDAVALLNAKSARRR